MSYLIIILAFTLNFFIWKKFLSKTLLKSKNLNKLKQVLIGYSLFLFLPYAFSLILLGVFNLNTNLLNNVILVVALALISTVSYKSIINVAQN